MPLIFQYGSNCNLRRLNHATRLAHENPRRVQTVGRYKLAFNKRTKDNYAAADLIKSGTAGRRIWGILYEVSERGFERLRNDVEGPSYEPKDILVEQADGEARTVKTFVVIEGRRRVGLCTNFKYVRHIVNGLRSRDVPEEYVRYVIDVALRTNRQADDQTAAARQSPRIDGLHRPPRNA